MVCGGLWVEFDVFVTYSFRSLASLLICLRPALVNGGLGRVMVGVFGLWICMDQILVAMS